MTAATIEVSYVERARHALSPKCGWDANRSGLEPFGKAGPSILEGLEGRFCEEVPGPDHETSHEANRGHPEQLVNSPSGGWQRRRRRDWVPQLDTVRHTLGVLRLVLSRLVPQEARL